MNKLKNKSHEYLNKAIKPVEALLYFKGKAEERIDNIKWKGVPADLAGYYAEKVHKYIWKDLKVEIPGVESAYTLEGRIPNKNRQIPHSFKIILHVEEDGSATYSLVSTIDDGAYSRISISANKLIEVLNKI